MVRWRRLAGVVDWPRLISAFEWRLPLTEVRTQRTAILRQRRPLVKGGPMASSGQDDPLASAHEYDPTATADQGAPVATADESDPLAAAGQGGPLAPASQRGPLARAHGCTPALRPARSKIADQDGSHAAAARKRTARVLLRAVIDHLTIVKLSDTGAERAPAELVALMVSV
jgi:hypothetical protein